MQKLIATGAIARSQLDSAQADWLVASARVKSSEAALRNARESLGWTRLYSPGGGLSRRSAPSRSGGQRRRDGGDAGGGSGAWCLISRIPKVEAQRAEEFQVALLSDAGVKAYAVFADISPQADPRPDMARQGNAQETARDGAGRQRHGKAVIRLDGIRHTGFCAEPLRR